MNMQTETGIKAIITKIIILDMETIGTEFV